MLTCCGTPVGLSWRTMASILVRSKPTSATNRSSTRCVTPSWRRHDLRAYSETEHHKGRKRKLRSIKRCECRLWRRLPKLPLDGPPKNGTGCCGVFCGAPEISPSSFGYSPRPTLVSQPLVRSLTIPLGARLGFSLVSKTSMGWRIKHGAVTVAHATVGVAKDLMLEGSGKPITVFLSPIGGRS
jgi:hypothetical protein